MSAAKVRAKQNGLLFSLVLEDIKIPAICPILGIQIKVADGLPNDNSPSLDRIVPNQGYIRTNVQIISWRANSLKKNATAKELMLLAEYMTKKA